MHVEGAGCYGHNGADDVALDAALLARATAGRPVQAAVDARGRVTWEPYGSAMVMKLGGALDAQGNIVDWSHELLEPSAQHAPGESKGAHTCWPRWHLAKPSPPRRSRDMPQPAGGADRNAIPLYDFPTSEGRPSTSSPRSPLRTSALRTLGAYANVFALESFMDELAAAAGADPVEFRLRHMKDPRARAVIEAPRRSAGWQAGRASDGTRGRGFAFARYKNVGCYCAVVAEVARRPQHRPGSR